jgi:hypothetical protein
MLKEGKLHRNSWFNKTHHGQKRFYGDENIFCRYQDT